MTAFPDDPPVGDIVTGARPEGKASPASVLTAPRTPVTRWNRKYLLAGADVVQSASALLRHGPEYAGVLLEELSHWMNRKGFQGLHEVRGLLAAPDADDSEARERADYVWTMRKANSGIYETY